MKSKILVIISLLFALTFQSCEKSENLGFKQSLLKYKEWNAEKFIVNGKNTMPPDNSDILDAPVSYIKVKFIDESNMKLEIELVYSDGSKDNSGELPMEYSTNDKDTTIIITDNNEWTGNLSFSGVHKALISNDNLTLKGKLGNKYNYSMILKGN